MVLASNALRAVDLARALKPLSGEKGGEVTKVGTVAPSIEI
jgi:hypothetical protein